MRLLKILILMCFSVYSLNLFAKDCFNISPENVQLEWMAFKTLSKKGVKGTFKKIKLIGPLKSDTIKNLILTTSFEIDTKTVYSKNSARDAKLNKYIFKTLSTSKISGKFLKLNNDNLIIKISMNGTTKDVPFKMSLKENKIFAEGHIDILDFSMSDELKAINKACFELHKGKTWSDVKLTLKATFLSC